MLNRKLYFEKFSENKNIHHLNYQNHFKEKFPEITSIISVKEWIKFYMGDKNRGFKKESIIYSFFRKFFDLNIQILEKILDEPLLIRAHVDNFSFIEPRFKKIINRLEEKGIISSFYRHKMKPDFPAITSYSFRLNPIPTQNGKLIHLNGSLSGSSFDSNSAVATAIAETLERYSLCYWKDTPITKGSFNELSEIGAINPLLFKSFSDLQLKDHKTNLKHYFDNNTKFGWVKARSFLTDNTCLIPAQLAYLGYASEEGEPIIRQTTTNGAAAGESIERSIYSGLCETIERDAFMIFWLNKITPRRIDENTIKNEKILRLLNQYKNFNIDLRIFDITSDLNVPTFFILVLDKTDSQPALYVSAATDLDAEDALIHALTESIRIGSNFMTHLFSEGGLKNAIESYPNFKNIRERACWWSQAESIKNIEWLMNAPKKPFYFPKCSAVSYREKHDKLKEIFLKNNLEAYIIDVKNIVTDEFGLNVVMTSVPGLYTLYLNENYKYFGIRRLYDLPVKLGYFKEPKNENELNRVPHPML